ncbi:MAG: hypothetical protein KJZ93_03270 [Caldilineaceae bacterium]|nr:hypothetical protein [Caldilineaceae bacterium]
MLPNQLNIHIWELARERQGMLLAEAARAQMLAATRPPRCSLPGKGVFLLWAHRLHRQPTTGLAAAHQAK